MPSSIAKRTRQPAIAALAFELGTGRQASARVQLFPAGRFTARDGRPRTTHGIDAWYIDGDIARRLIAEAAARQTPYVIDYEHQTLATAENGQPAPRAARFTQLEWVEGEGLFATDTEWTARAKGYIEADEYDFLSPVFAFDPRTGAVTRLLHAALTNDPAVDGMGGVGVLAAARFQPQAEIPMDREQLIAALGLADSATDADIQAAVVALKAKADLAGGLQTEVAALKANAGSIDPTKYVPIAAMTALQAEVAALKARQTEDDVTALVEQGVAEGKLIGDEMRDWATQMGKADIAALRNYLGAAAPIAALKGTQTHGKQPDGVDAPKLTDDELAVCKSLGVKPEDYAKNREVTH